MLFDDGGSVLIAAIAHLMGSLQAELSARDSPVMIHTLSPGMVLTGTHTSPQCNCTFCGFFLTSTLYLLQEGFVACMLASNNV